MVATSSDDAVTGTKDSPRMLASAATNNLVKMTAGQTFLTSAAASSNATEFYNFSANGMPAIAHVAQLGNQTTGAVNATNEPEWRLVIAAPQADFTETFNAKLMRASLWAVGLFLLAVVAGVWLASRLVSSVSQVVNAAAQIGGGDLSRPAIKSRFAEFQQINHRWAIQQMRYANRAMHSWRKSKC